MGSEKTNAALSRSSVAEWESENQKLTNSSTEPQKINNSRRDLLESTKKSRMPTLPRRPAISNNAPLQRPTGKTDTCVKCEVELNEDNQKTTANVCRKCLSEFAIVERELNRTADQKVNAARLNKFFGGGR